MGAVYEPRNPGHRKGASCVVDDCDSSAGSVGIGAGEQLHDGRIHSPSVGSCDRRGARQSHPGTTARVAGRHVVGSAMERDVR